MTTDENGNSAIGNNRSIGGLGDNASHLNLDSNINGNDDDKYNDDESSGSGLSSGGYNDDQSTSNDTHISTTNGSQPSQQSLDIAKKENIAVNTWRFVMFFVLIITTVLVAVLVFLFVKSTERQEFETSFESDSLKIYESLGSSMDNKLHSVDSLAMFMVSSAREKNETWPYTVLPDFASKAAKMKILSHAIALQQYQYVEEDQRVEWEAYAKANEAWVQETIEIQREDTTFHAPMEIPDYDGTNHSTSIRYDGPVQNNTGPYMPSWQTYPMVTTGNFTAYNWNAIDHKTLGPGIKKVLVDHTVVIGPVLNFEDSRENG